MADRGQVQRPHAGASRSRRRRRSPGWLTQHRAVVIAATILLTLALIAGGAVTADALSLEDHDPFCASCHTQPETRYVAQSLATQAANLAALHAEKAVRCIDCHSGSGPFGRLSGLYQGGQDLLAYERGHYHAPAVTLHKLGNGSCTKCHADVLGRNSFDNHFHLFLAQWRAMDANAAGCVDCHTGHAAASPQNGYMDVVTVQAECQACHEVLRGG